MNLPMKVLKIPCLLCLTTLCLFPNGFIKAQTLSSTELLERSINFHDPHKNWSSFKGMLQITMQTPEKSDRISEIVINLPEEYFKLIEKRDDYIMQHIMDKEECFLTLNDRSDFSDEDAKKHRLTCERTETMKNYYTYLYGLPMKLRDPGTIIHPGVSSKTFKGKKYLVLKASYEKEVGGDVWYFYFDPKTYAMEIYQFYHDEAKNDGEYILLEGLYEVSGIKMPSIRTWYYNKNDAYLGTDTLDHGSALDQE